MRTDTQPTFPDNLQIHSDHTQMAPPLECCPPLASDGLILVIWRCPGAHSTNFVVIQAHLSRRFYLAVDVLGLRRSGSWSQIIDQAQDFPEQVSRLSLSG